MTTHLNDSIAQAISAHICDPSGFGKRVTATRDGRFVRPSHADKTHQFDEVYEEMWPWLAKETLHTVTTLERHNRLRADIWCAMKTGDLAGTPDLVLPIATIFVDPRETTERNPHLRAALDLQDAAERVTAFVRLRSLVPADRILHTWRFASELAEQGEVLGTVVEWTVTENHQLVHFMNGKPVTSQPVDEIECYWDEISSLHNAAS